MDNNNDSFNSLGLDGVTMHDNSTQTPAQQTNGAVSDKELDDLTNEEVIDLFIRGIMEEKGVTAPTPEIEQSIFEDLRTRLLEQIDRSLIAELPNDKLEELNKLALEKGQIEPQLIAKMVEEAHLDVAEITGVTMERFREIYLGKTTDANPTKAEE
ncbi:hypothetical protein IKG64_01415 [Candidatus Saccharibacteria bacterium]|nr:hypothetical protein [Candidatus Saccharibacteria bacterium]